MTASDAYIVDSIRILVWSGFYGPDDVHQMIEDILEDDDDEEFLHAAVAPEFRRKARAEKAWPETTDCDRLNRAFLALNGAGIIALQNAGMDTSEGHEAVEEVLAEPGAHEYEGYCFYHNQDMERGIMGRGLLIAFGHLDDDAETVRIGQQVAKALMDVGLGVEWDGSASERINIPNLKWQRRWTGGA